MNAINVALISSLLAACAQRTPTQTPANNGFVAGVYVVRIKSATIDRLRPEGVPWHISEPDGTMALVGSVAGLVVGQPDLGAAVGEALSDPGGKPVPPSPFVRLRIGEKVWTTAAIDRSLDPAWNETITVDAREFTGDESFLIWVVDEVDGQLIATSNLSALELFGESKQTVTRFDGAVHTMEVESALLGADGVDAATREDMGRGL